MEIRELLTGTRLELTLLDKNNNVFGNSYVSQLFEPAKGDKIVVSAPIFESRLIYIPLNSKIRICFPHGKHGLMGFTARVTDRGNKGNISVLYLHKETDLERIQRRDYYRLDCNIDVEYRLHFDKTAISAKAETPYKKALSKNISGSGVCIIVNENIPKGVVLNVHLYFSNSIITEAVCTVVRSIKLDITKNSRYELGLHFTEISAIDQENIVKFIHEQQRFQLKKDGYEK